MTAASIFDRVKFWASIETCVTFTCAICDKEPKAMLVISEDNLSKGLRFLCHGQEEFLPLSEAQLRYPKRLRGYKPFEAKSRPPKIETMKIPLASPVRRAKIADPPCPVCGGSVTVATYRDELQCRTRFRFFCHGQIEDASCNDTDLQYFAANYRPFQSPSKKLPDIQIVDGSSSITLPTSIGSGEVISYSLSDEARIKPSVKPVEFFAPTKKPRVIKLDD